MRNKLLKNYIYNLSYQLLLLIVPIVTIPYVSRTLKAENIGLYNFFYSVVSYFVLFGCLGLNLYGQREVAFYKDDKFKRSQIFWELFSIRVVTIIISTICYWFIIVQNSTGYSTQYAIFTIEILAASLDISWFFQGVEDFKQQTIRSLIVKIFGTIAIFIFVKDVGDLNKYIWCHVGMTLFSNILLWPQLRKYVFFVKIRLFGVLKYFGPVMVMFIPQVAISVYAQLDKTMIRLFSDYLEVSYYSQAEKIVKIILTVVTSLGLVMLSRVATSFSKGNTDAIHEYITKSFKFISLIAYPCTFGLMAVSYDIVPWFFGEGFEKVAPCMVFLGPIIIFIGMSNIIGTQYLLPTNRMKEYTLSVVGGLMINVTLNSILITKFGCVGAAVATVFAEAGVIIIQLFFVRKEFSVKELILSGYKNFISAAVMGIIVFLIASNLANTLPNTVLEVAIGGIIYFVILVFVLRDKFLINTLKSFLGK